MVTINGASFLEIGRIISSVEYEALAQKVVISANKVLCADMYDAEIEYCVKLLDASKVPMEQIRKLICENQTEFHDYCVAYIAVSSIVEQGQEYNPADPPMDEESTNEFYVGHSKTFLFQNAIYYLTLKFYLSDLESFVKKARVPHAKKYAKALSAFFNEFERRRGEPQL